MKFFKRIIILFIGLLLLYYSYNVYQIYSFSTVSTKVKADVAIVLGAGTTDSSVSPIFRERLNHAYDLWEEKRVKFILITGGKGKGRTIADSDVAFTYLVAKGCPTQALLTEKHSTTTYENLVEAKKILTQKGFNKAIIVSDPLHMKRAIAIAHALQITCYSSPTPTSMYRSFSTKMKQLASETMYYTWNKLLFTY